MIKEYKINKCRLCKSENLNEVYAFKKTPIGDDYRRKIIKHNFFELKVKICKKCEFVQLSNVIDPDRVYGDYLYITESSVGLVNHFNNLVIELFKKNILNNTSQVLEIGSNDGSLQKILKEKCYFVLGVDPAAHLSLQKDLIVMKGLYDSKFSKKVENKFYKFDVIIANNVIANIDNLDTVFKGIRNNLVDGGYFVMETFSLSKLLSKNLIDNIYHEHISYFTFETISNFSKKYNLQLVDGSFEKVKGGSLRLIFKKQKIIFNNKKIKKLINKEKKNNNIKKYFHELRKVNNENKRKIISYLDKKNLKKIIGFGASVGTTTLIYDFELVDRISYIFDNEKKRNNVYLPGTTIKVKLPKKIQRHKVVLIFAWRYFKDILKRNKNIFPKGTTFIIPLPKFKVIKI
jgi:SAM-dependent methyltransferase